MSETPQEILDRAAPIWDRHVVSFTLVLAALRSVLAERDALRAEVTQAEGVARGYMLAAEKAEAALLDAQHQEAQDIEALDKLGNAYDAAATAWGRDEAEYIREIAALRGVAR